MRRVRIQRDAFVSGFSFVYLKDAVEYTLELSVYNRETNCFRKMGIEANPPLLGKEYHLIQTRNQARIRRDFLVGCAELKEHSVSE